MSREVLLFPEWYAPALGMEVDEASYMAAWRQVWGDVLDIVERNPVMVLRDYHADNLMVLPGRAELGLLDFPGCPRRSPGLRPRLAAPGADAMTSRRSSRRR
jgi:aminoglycoside/choline kinase family phosphotransferase